MTYLERLERRLASWRTAKDNGTVEPGYAATIIGQIEEEIALARREQEPGPDGEAQAKSDLP